MKYFSMFSGIGGFEVGIGQAIPTAECIGYSEINKKQINIYERHFDHTNYGDATKINAADLPDFDLLVGGFPCQAFSVAGRREGFNDIRGTLFFDIARIAKEKRPKYLLLENVKGLLSHDSGRTYKTILSTLTELGYDIRAMVLNSKNYGVPQNRERVFIAGCLGGWGERQIFPIRPTSGGENQEPVPIECRDSIKPLWKVADLESARRAILGGRKLRHFTEKEYARLQGYPDNWFDGISWADSKFGAGNSVTVNVVREVIKNMFQ